MLTSRYLSGLFVAMLLVMSMPSYSQTLMPRVTNEESFAYIIVTGLLINETSQKQIVESYPGKSAVVKLISSTGEVQQKTAQLFVSNTKGNAGKPYYTADFKVELDSVYTILMLINNKTIRMEDYRLPKKWKTHFSYHSTNGTSSPASVFRKEPYKKTGLTCCVYGIFPYAYYKSLGGTQY
jgi:hypothetical protein